jgi:hypothetical protein
MTLLVWMAPLVVKLPPALLSGSQSRTSPTTMARWRHLVLGGGGDYLRLGLLNDTFYRTAFSCRDNFAIFDSI